MSVLSSPPRRTIGGASLRSGHVEPEPHVVTPRGVLQDPELARRYAELASVTLNPRRHTASDALAHSEAVAATARRLGQQNGCSPAQLQLLEDLGRVHDIGKITGTARPEASLDVLTSCGITDTQLLALVERHDCNLPWFQSHTRGQAPSDKAWRRLAAAVDLRLLCIFMVADRVDAPGGWRRNAPTLWFLEQARTRGLIDELQLDLLDTPSERCAGAALIREANHGPELLLIRTRAHGYALPKGGIELDELPIEAAARELREEAGVLGQLELDPEPIGALEYDVGHRKRVTYFRARASSAAPELGDKPKETRERRWLNAAALDEVELVNEDLRPLLAAALRARQARA
jgi:8-oxo-dGTP pyrophosphatase MutT (NUDIX family)